jgi:hypothetical protein
MIVNCPGCGRQMEHDGGWHQDLVDGKQACSYRCALEARKKLQAGQGVVTQSEPAAEIGVDRKSTPIV